jgi:hypothetical protein
MPVPVAGYTSVTVSTPGHLTGQELLALIATRANQLKAGCR